jgi:hypothetical protein
MRILFPTTAKRLIIILCASFLPAAALGHTHVDPDGSTVSWYPRECCSNHDCQPVTEIRAMGEYLRMTTANGWSLSVNRTLPRLASRDMRWHICIGTDDADVPFVRCVFEPPNS